MDQFLLENVGWDEARRPDTILPMPAGCGDGSTVLPPPSSGTATTELDDTTTVQFGLSGTILLYRPSTVPPGVGATGQDNIVRRGEAMARPQ